MSSLRSPATRACALVLLVTGALSACGDDKSGSEGDSGGTGSGNAGTGGTSAASGSCKEAELFDPRPFGDDGQWVIGEVHADPDSGDVYFSTQKELYVARKGSQDAELITGRPTDVWSDFWLTDDGFLFPSGFQVPLVDQEIAVLFTMPRSGGEPSVQVAAPVSSDEGWVYHISSVVVACDEVIWIGSDGFSAEPWRTPPTYDTTYYLRKTNWRTPGEPSVLYESKHELSGLIVAAGKAYVDEAQDDSIGSDSDQRIVALDGSGAETMSAQQRYYGAEVVAGDDESLIVTHQDFDDPAGFGTFRVAADGSGSEEKLGDVLLLRIGEVPAASHDGKWVFLRSDGFDRWQVLAYEPGSEVREIGCIEADHQGGLVLADGEALIGVRHDDQSSTVLRFPL